CADGTRGESHRVGPEALQRADQRSRFREEQLGEDEASDGAVEEEIIPLDSCADRARDDRPPQLHAVLAIGEWSKGRRWAFHETPVDRIAARVQWHSSGMKAARVDCK